MRKYMFLLALVMFIITSSLLVNIASIGQAPLAMYLFVGGIGYCVSITVIVLASLGE